MLRRIAATLLLSLAVSPALAADAGSPVPDRRLVTEMGQDFYGGDIGSIFDTDFARCQAECLRDASCKALTFNMKASACFLKSGVERVDPFAGAVSARVVETSEAARALAGRRAAELGFLPDGLIAEASRLAGTLGGRVAANGADPAGLRAAAAAAEREGDLGGAAQDYASAATVTDAADDWRDLARFWMEMAAAPLPPQTGGDEQAARDRLRRDAVAAAVNAYLRDDSDAARAGSLAVLARTLEARGLGRQMIPALKLAQSLSPRQETADLLDYAVSNYGFRVVDHSIESESARPRMCVVFSEPLAEAVDYAPYVRVEGHDTLPVEAENNQLCVEGVEHGQSYRLAVREGLPSAEGETLRRTVEVEGYVRDRSPAVRFVGRAYVLPRSAEAAIPVVTVNTDTVELKIFRLGERSLVPAIGDDLFDSAISKWTEDRLKDRTGEAVWSGTAEVEGAVNADVTTALPIGEAVGSFEPGVYAMTARVTGDTDEWQNAATQWFIVTDLGLASISGTDGVHVFARALSDATPVAGATVRLVARNNDVLGEAATDAQGYRPFRARPGARRWRRRPGAGHGRAGRRLRLPRPDEAALRPQRPRRRGPRGVRAGRRLPDDRARRLPPRRGRERHGAGPRRAGAGDPRPAADRGDDAAGRRRVPPRRAGRRGRRRPRLVGAAGRRRAARHLDAEALRRPRGRRGGQPRLPGRGLRARARRLRPRRARGRDRPRRAADRLAGRALPLRRAGRRSAGRGPRRGRERPMRCRACPASASGWRTSMSAPASPSFRR